MVHCAMTLTCVFATPAMWGASRSQSCIDWLRRAILRTSFPPFTFHVPIHTLSLSGVV